VRPVLQTIAAPMAAGRQLVQTHGDPCAVEFRKRVSSWSSLRCGLNSNRYRAGLLEVDKRCQLFVGADDESLSVGGVFLAVGCSSRFDQLRGFLGGCYFSNCPEANWSSWVLCNNVISKRRDNNGRPSYQNVRFPLSSAGFFLVLRKRRNEVLERNERRLSLSSTSPVRFMNLTFFRASTHLDRLARLFAEFPKTKI
jgi:hypothetical protein